MDWIDAILYINLDYRTDRNEKIHNELKKMNVDFNKVKRVDAVLEKQCGHLGCGKSHIKCLEMAIVNNWDNVLILEDDFMFTESLANVNKGFTQIKKLEWDVILLAIGHNKIVDSSYPFLSKIISATTTSGYIVRKHYYATLLANFKEAVSIMEGEVEKHIAKCIKEDKPVTKLNYCRAIDQHWHSLQKKNIFYSFKPVLGNQGNNIYSDNNCSAEHQANQAKKMGTIF